jgi:hypothetical protein
MKRRDWLRLWVPSAEELLALLIVVLVALNLVKGLS